MYTTSLLQEETYCVVFTPSVPDVVGEPRVGSSANRISLSNRQALQSRPPGGIGKDYMRNMKHFKRIVCFIMKYHASREKYQDFNGKCHVFI